MVVSARAWCLLFVLILGLTAWDARAQNASIGGFVTDASSGQPLEFVNVVFTAEGGTARVVTSGRDGSYVISGITPGRYVLNATYIGYTAFADTLVLAAGERRTIDIRLAPADRQLEEVVVESERTSGAARVIAGQQTVTPADLEMVPSPDVSADLVNYLTTMPGVVTTGDRGGQLYIRGGEPSQNLVLLDGIPLYQPFHVLGFYSAFPAEIMNRADIYAGGFGSRFGGRVSSVLDVISRSGNEHRFAGTFAASPFVSAASIEGPIVPGRFSFLGSIRQSFLEEGAEPLTGRRLPFKFGDGFFKIQGRLTSRSRISISGIKTFDRGIIGEDTGGVPPDEVRWENQGIGFRYVVLPKILPLTAVVNVTHSRLTSEQGPPGASYRMSSVQTTKVGIDASFVGKRINTDTGLTVEAIDLDSRISGLFQGLDLRASEFTAAAMYLEPEFRVGGGLRIRPGLRMQFYQVRFDPYVEPRVRVTWDRGMHHFSAATGLYYQEVVGLSDRRDAASVFTVWANIPRQESRTQDVRAGRLSRAVHAILGYRISPTPWLDLSIEGFHKEMDNLFVGEWTPFPRLSTRVQPASGHSSGFDVRAEFRPGRFYGFVTYGYARTIYNAEQEELIFWYGEERIRYRPAHDRRHQVNTLISTRLAGFDVSARWAFGSGLPFSRAIGFDGFVFLDDVRDLSKSPSTRRVIYERPYNGLLPTYHRLDLSVDRSFDLEPARITVQGSIINLYDRNNIFYLDVFTLQRVDQLPIVPSFGVKVEF